MLLRFHWHAACSTLLPVTSASPCLTEVCLYNIFVVSLFWVNKISLPKISNIIWFRFILIFFPFWNYRQINMLLNCFEEGCWIFFPSFLDPDSKIRCTQRTGGGLTDIIHAVIWRMWLSHGNGFKFEPEMYLNYLHAHWVVSFWEKNSREEINGISSSLTYKRVIIFRWI